MTKSVRQKRLDILLSKTDKIVNRLNEAMQESMSNVLKAAEEAKKADLEMKQRLDEEKNLVRRQKLSREAKDHLRQRLEAGPLSRSRRPAIMRRK